MSIKIRTMYYNTAFHETEYYHHIKRYIITLKHFDFVYKHK